MEDKCVYCGSIEGLEYHHILPRSMGGTDESFNLVRVCNNHHAILHGLTSRGNISTLIKAGLEKTKLTGTVLGPPLKIFPHVLKLLCERKSEGATYDQLAEEFAIPRSLIARNVKRWTDNLSEYEAIFERQST